MAWNWKPQGVGPTEGNISFSGGISPQYAPRNQISDAAQEAIKTITAFLQQKERNEIANQILAVDNAPKAVAVNGMQPDIGKYQSDPVLTRAMMARNLSLGYPTADSGKTPDYGGTQGLATSDLIRKRLSEGEDSELERQIKQAKLKSALLGPQPRPMTEYERWRTEHPTPAKSPATIMTPSGPTTVPQANYDRLTETKPDTIEKISTDLKALTGHPYADWANASNKHIGTDEPAESHFDWKSGQWISTPAKHIDDQKFHATMVAYDKEGGIDKAKTGEATIPVDLYERMLARRNALDNPPQQARPAQAGEQVGGPQVTSQSQAEQIRSAFAAGKITREEARKQLQQLGYQ